MTSIKLPLKYTFLCYDIALSVLATTRLLRLHNVKVYNIVFIDTVNYVREESLFNVLYTKLPIGETSTKYVVLLSSMSYNVVCFTSSYIVLPWR